MPKASELKKGAVVEIDGNLYVVRQVDVRSPSSRGAQTLYKLRFSQVSGGRKLEQTLKGDDWLKDVDLVRRQVQFSYRDGDMITFMDTGDYSQYTLAVSDLEEQMNYLSEDLEGVTASIMDGMLIGIELPQTVILEISDTSPAIKGASAAARTKTAQLTTGLEIQVPEYLQTGDRVKVNTANGKFISRV
jgi:elongation factor P